MGISQNQQQYIAITAWYYKKNQASVVFPGSTASPLRHTVAPNDSGLAAARNSVLWSLDQLFSILQHEVSLVPIHITQQFMEASYLVPGQRETWHHCSCGALPRPGESSETLKLASSLLLWLSHCPSVVWQTSILGSFLVKIVYSSHIEVKCDVYWKYRHCFN